MVRELGAACGMIGTAPDLKHGYEDVSAAPLFRIVVSVLILAV